MKNVDVKVMVADNVVALIDEAIAKVEAGERGSWRKPWAVTGTDWPCNWNGVPYRGVNTFILSLVAQSQGYESNVWMTFRKISERGGKVRRGEHGTMIVFWKRGTRKSEDEDGNEVTVPTFLLRYYKVWNLDQTEDVKVPRKVKAMLDKPEAPEVEPIDEAEALVATYFWDDEAPTLTEGGDRAAYSPVKDSIVVPKRADYDNPAEFYSTLFHEMTHSTGHKSRCSREGITEFDHFGSDKYGREELVAEMGSAMLIGIAGIDAPEVTGNQVEYLTNWGAAIKANKTMFVDAAGKAQRAVDFITGTKFGEDE